MAVLCSMGLDSMEGFGMSFHVVYSLRLSSSPAK